MHIIPLRWTGVFLYVLVEVGKRGKPRPQRRCHAGRLAGIIGSERLDKPPGTALLSAPLEKCERNFVGDRLLKELPLLHRGDRLEVQRPALVICSPPRPLERRLFEEFAHRLVDAHIDPGLRFHAEIGRKRPVLRLQIVHHLACVLQRNTPLVLHFEVRAAECSERVLREQAARHE